MQECNDPVVLCDIINRRGRGRLINRALTQPMGHRTEYTIVLIDGLTKAGCRRPNSKNVCKAEPSGPIERKSESTIFHGSAATAANGAARSVGTTRPTVAMASTGRSSLPNKTFARPNGPIPRPSNDRITWSGAGCRTMASDAHVPP